MDKELPARVGKNIVLIHKEKKTLSKIDFFSNIFFQLLNLNLFLHQ